MMEEKRMAQLDPRLERVADFVRPGALFADVGCDHGHLSVELMRRGAQRGFACDIKEGPLQAAKRIGLSDCRGLQTMDAQGTFFLGRIGSLPEGMEPQQFAQYLKQRLGAPSVKFAAADRTVKTVALCGGAGADCLEDAIRVGADALLTSEVKQHEYLAAAAAGISIFDAGHFDTEDVVIEPLWEYLTKQFADVEFFTTHHTVIRAV